MTEHAINLSSSLRTETDGSKTVVVEVTGIRSTPEANKVSEWLHRMLVANANKLGRLAH